MGVTVLAQASGHPPWWGWLLIVAVGVGFVYVVTRRTGAGANEAARTVVGLIWIGGAIYLLIRLIT